MNLNERFTDFADRVSERAGTWPVFVISILLILSWIIMGPAMHFSDTWQLLVNTPTTVVELFLGLLTLASANRVQRNNEHMMKELDQLIRAAIREERKVEKGLIVSKNTLQKGAS